MRCLALAQAWQDAGGPIVFAMGDRTAAIQERLRADSCEVVSISSRSGTSDDAQETIAIAGRKHASWVVVDGYQFNADYQSALKAGGLKVLFLDDYGHAPRYSADLVLNQNVSASAALYQDREPGTRLLLGPRFALLRREFSLWRDWERKISPRCNRVLVMMGGSDPGNLSARVIEALELARIGDLEVTIIVGGSNPHLAQLREATAHAKLKIDLRQYADSIGELMSTADIAVSAAGSTCWELCLLALPSLLLDVADNQTSVAAELHRRGCALHIGDRSISPEKLAEGLKSLCGSQELRQSLARRSRELVDGNGARRVVSMVRGGESVRLRPARMEDRGLLWEWANDPEVRAASFLPDPISWSTHVAWFEGKLRPVDEQGALKSYILIAEDEESTPIGQIRFDARADGDWEVGVSIAKQMRNRGLARDLIENGLIAILKEDLNARVHAFVKPSNIASMKAFERAAFRRIDAQEIRGHQAVHLIYERS